MPWMGGCVLTKNILKWVEPETLALLHTPLDSYTAQSACGLTWNSTVDLLTELWSVSGPIFLKSARLWYAASDACNNSVAAGVASGYGV